MAQWKTLRSIINGYSVDKDLFMTLMDKEGNIMSANSIMQRTLHLEDPRETNINFFQLLQPADVLQVKQAFLTARSQNKPATTELYLKNGYYHPMKWQISHLESPQDAEEKFFCMGYKLVDDERLEKFNRLGEKNYQVIVEGLNAGVLFQDRKGDLIAANKKSAEIFDTTLERLYELKDIKQAWNSWTVTREGGQSVSFENTPFMKALDTGTLQTEVLEITLRSGEERSVLFNSQPLFENNDNIPYAVVSNILDVTREKKLHSEVKDRDILFRSFLDKTPNLAWVLDEEAILLFASTAFYQYFGLKPEAANGRNIFELIPDSVADTLYRNHLHVLETGKSIEKVEKVKWSDGTNFMFHINIFPIDTGSGRKFLGGHAVNLADKFAIEKQLREVNDRLLLLTRATSDAIWEWDMQTGQIFRNDVLMEMIGYQGDDAKGLSWWLRRIHPEDRNRVTDKIKEATDKGNHSWEDKYRFKCSDGSYKYVQDHGYVVYENGLPVKMIGSLQDISEMKNLEDQLTQEKLQRQKEISETVIRVQERERTRIGHELHDNVNQILSTTKMFVELLKPASDEEKKIKEKSVEYLLTAIEEIRKLSKELVVPQLKESGLIESIQTLIEDIQLSGKLNINFTHDEEFGLLSSGKKVTLFRIIQEQFKNILKYSKATKVDVRLTCNNSHVLLFIKDDGVGFDTKRSYRGIGLSNIHDRARFYNGTVEITSSPGNGCQIDVSIPLFN